MRSHVFCFVLGFLVSAACVGVADVQDSTSAFSLGVSPSLEVPIASSAHSVSGSVDVNLQYDLSQPTGALLRGGVSYFYDPYLGGNSLSLFALHLDGGYQFAFSPRFRLGAFAGGGYNYGFKNVTGESGGSLFVEGGLGIDLVLTPRLGISLGGSYRYYSGLLHAAGAYLGATYYFSGAASRQAIIQSAKPIDVELLKGYRTAPPGKGLSIEKIDFDPIFPVFRKYYDDHPIGTVTIKNNEKQAISGVSAGVYIKEYMNDPKVSPVEAIAPGSTVQVPVFALFNEHVLDTTEPTKTSTEITVDYRMDDANYRTAVTETVRMLDRNAMTWDDDRRAAAFVTAKDPAVLAFAKHISGLVREQKVAGMNEKLQTACALHEALTLYGISYVVDPASSYAEQSKDKVSADFLQFPRQTLQYKAGDCDDLSILNAALLESVGIPTAFVTVPGHIFIAFSLGISPEEARRSFSTTDDLLIRDNDVWVPVEVTDIGNGFLSAWRLGAKEWRESNAKGTAAFYPVRNAWAVYEAVGLPGAPPDVALPQSERIASKFEQEAKRYVDSELSPQVARLEAALRTSANVPAALNRLGVLYARFGRYEQATAQFRRALSLREYLPAILNLANISYLAKEWSEAFRSYEQASKIDPLNSRVLLGLARSAYELEDYATATKQYEYVKKLDPSLAERFTYLDRGSARGNRAADAAAEKRIVVWEESE